MFSLAQIIVLSDMPGNIILQLCVEEIPTTERYHTQIAAGQKSNNWIILWSNRQTRLTRLRLVSADISKLTKLSTLSSLTFLRVAAAALIMICSE